MSKKQTQTDRLIQLEKKITELETRIANMEKQLDIIMHSNEDMKLILQYVVLPLLVILASLIGLKLTIPTT